MKFNSTDSKSSSYSLLATVICLLSTVSAYTLPLVSGSDSGLKNQVEIQRRSPWLNYPQAIKGPVAETVDLSVPDTKAPIETKSVSENTEAQELQTAKDKVNNLFSMLVQNKDNIIQEGKSIANDPFKRALLEHTTKTFGRDFINNANKH